MLISLVDGKKEAIINPEKIIVIFPNGRGGSTVSLENNYNVNIEDRTPLEVADIIQTAINQGNTNVDTTRNI